MIDGVYYKRRERSIKAIKWDGYYKRRERSIKAIKWDGTLNSLERNVDSCAHFVDNEGKHILKTPIGEIEIHPGDYITKNYQGEYEVYTPGVFKCKYEERKYR